MNTLALALPATPGGTAQSFAPVGSGKWSMLSPPPQPLLSCPMHPSTRLVSQVDSAVIAV